MVDPVTPLSETYTISNQLGQRIQEALGQNIYLCYQCIKCSSGCPMAEFFDWQPNQILRALQLGQEDIALESKTPWLCASCQTCTTRCPQELDIAGIMEFLTQEALRRGIKPPVAEVNIFNQAFLRQVRLWGRAFELGLMAELKLRTGNLFSDMDLAVQMIGKHKIPFLPKAARTPHHVKPQAGATIAVAYYPGCSLHSTATEFDISARAVCKKLGVELIEPCGWVCCGSSAAHRSNPELALRLPMENLALVEKSGFQEVTMPCAACFNRHKAAQYEIRHDERQARAIFEKLDYQYLDRVKVNTFIQTIHQHIGPEKLAAQVTHSLKGLRVVCYYGCLLTRPPQITEAAQPENPTDMDELITALGAEVLDWSYKTSCCGAAHSLTRPDIVLELSGRLIQHARRAGADLIAVACPLCHANLDARQIQMSLPEPMPVLYFTQLVALALGLPAQATALDKNLIDPRPVLAKRRILSKTTTM